MLLAPIGNPEPRDCIPLDTPYIFLGNGTQTVKMQFDTIPQKIQKEADEPVVNSPKLPFDAEKLIIQIWLFDFFARKYDVRIFLP